MLADVMVSKNIARSWRNSNSLRDTSAHSSVSGLTRLRTGNLSLAIARYSARPSDCWPIYWPIVVILLRSCQDPHIHPIFTLIGQHTNKNVDSLHTAKQVVRRCDLSCYLRFCCSVTPSFVLLGTNANSWCLEKLSHLSLLSRQAKTVIFIPKIVLF